MIGTAVQAGYLLWPAKRRFSNANFGHVLGLPPDHPRVRRLALRAYREYARYMVELMRLPSRPRAELVAAVEPAGVDEIVARWRASGRPMIVVAGHVGSNEAVGAALADRGLPVSVIADDSAFPELFDLLRRQREAWGVTLIPWRNLRELYLVLKRNEILALLVDWGYRSDGIPVKLFGAWTTLPAGPAALAAKSGRPDRPGRRPPPGRRRGTGWRSGKASPSRRRTRPTSSGPRSGSPTRSRPRSPPPPSSGTASSRCGPRTRPRPGRSRPRRSRRDRRRRDGLGGHGAGRPWTRARARPPPPAVGPAPGLAARWRPRGLVARLPEGPLVAAAESIGELWYRVAPARRAQARANLARVCEALAASGRGSAAARRAATDPDALERLVRAPSATRRATTSRWPARAPTTSTTPWRG